MNSHENVAYSGGNLLAVGRKPWLQFDSMCMYLSSADAYALITCTMFSLASLGRYFKYNVLQGKYA